MQSDDVGQLEQWRSGDYTRGLEGLFVMMATIMRPNTPSRSGRYVNKATCTSGYELHGICDAACQAISVLPSYYCAIHATRTRASAAVVDRKRR